MACTLTTGRKLPCKSAFGGIKRVYFADYGNSFLCGFENGMECTGGTVVTGAAAGDLSGFTLTFEGMEETAPYFLASAVTGDAAQVDPTA